jgi:hypothetical protein
MESIHIVANPLDNSDGGCATPPRSAIEPGFWETDGARGDGPNSQSCMWMWLFACEALLAKIFDGGGADVGEKIQVRIDPDDAGLPIGCVPGRTPRYWCNALNA